MKFQKKKGRRGIKIPQTPLIPRDVPAAIYSIQPPHIIPIPLSILLYVPSYSSYHQYLYAASIYIFFDLS